VPPDEPVRTTDDAPPSALQPAGEESGLPLQQQEAHAHAAAAVAPDDPLLDTAMRRVEARASAEHPFGRPGQPVNPRSPFRIAFSAALGVGAAALLAVAIVNVRGVLTLLAAALFLAIGLNPTVEWLERRGLRRGLAVTVVFFGLVTAFVGFGAAVFPPIVVQVTDLVDEIPGFLDTLTANERIDDLNEQFGFVDRAQEFVANEDFGVALFGGVVGVGRFVFGAFLSALTILILTLYFLVSFPAIKQRVYRLVPRSRRARVGLLTDEILSRVGGYVAGALTIGSFAGLSSFAFLLTAGVPYAVALALLVAVLDVIPLVGATIGAVVVTIVAFFVSAPVGVATAIFFLVYQQVENYYIYPRVMKRSVDVSPAATIVAVLIGGTLLGVLGALLAIPVMAALQLVLDEVVVPRQDRA
jgi:predicted PurR-regulated permease PerM